MIFFGFDGTLDGTLESAALPGVAENISVATTRKNATWERNRDMTGHLFSYQFKGKCFGEISIVPILTFTLPKDNLRFSVTGSILLLKPAAFFRTIRQTFVFILKKAFMVTKMKFLARYSLLSVIVFLGLIVLSGCNLIGRSKKPKPTPVKPYPMNRNLMKYAAPGTSSRNALLVMGFGLVYNLGDNGCVEVDSPHRRHVIEELKRSMKVDSPSQWIDSKDTAIVMVQAKIPPGIRKGEPLDVEITLPPGSECRSLQGGILHQTVLTEMYEIGSSFKRGNNWATVEGPILLDPNIDKNTAQYEKRAILLGKAECRYDRDFNLTLYDEGRNESQLAIIASELERRINKRFKIEGEPTGVAKARSQPEVNVSVKMHPHYREVPNRYLAVIMSIRCFENETQQAQRFEDLKQELLDPEKSLAAALQLEALPAKMGAEVLYDGMKSHNPDVRFHSAEALAYMHKPGVGPVLAEFARNDPKRRPAAIAGLASMGSDLEAEESLIPLMASGDSEQRYGAFWALRRRTPDHPAIRAWPMEVYPYHYHVLPFDEPLVHATTTRRSEIVLFSQNIRLNAPFVGNAGKSIVVNVQSPEQVEIIRVNPGRINETRLRPNSLDKVLEAIADLGGGYQDTLDFLIEADKEQQNGFRALSCRFELDGISQDKERSYNSAVYAEDGQEDKSGLPEPKKKKSTFGKLNPVTWFDKEPPAT